LRDEWNVPIFMGEGGENNKEWYSGAFAMYEELDISWNFWTYKKMDTTNSMVSVNKPKHWDRLVEHMEMGTELSSSDASEILSEYLHNIKLENCVLVDEVVNYLFRRPSIDLSAIFYNWDDNSKSAMSRNGNVGYRVEDGRDINFLDSKLEKPTFQHGRGQSWKDDEWLCVRMMPSERLDYWFSCEITQNVSLRLDLCVDAQSQVRISLNDTVVSLDFNPSERKSIEVISKAIDPGKSKVSIEVEHGQIRLITVGLLAI
jgi:endoglucanase